MSDVVQSWGDYRSEAFGDSYAVWQEGPDFTGFGQRWASDHVFVELMLTDGLLQRDPLAPQAIACLDLPEADRERFAELLRPHIGLAPVGFHLQVAQTLHRLTDSECWSSEVVRVLAGAGFWRDRMDAAVALAAFRPTDAIIAALAEGVRDPDYLVRYHSADTLLGYRGQRADDPANADLLALIRADRAQGFWKVASREFAAVAAEQLHVS